MVSSGAVQMPLSFSLQQNDTFVFLQINLDKKEFNAEQAEPELIVTPLEVPTVEEPNGEAETGEAA